MMMPYLQSGAPTLELFAESYNNTGKSNTITLGVGTYGYTRSDGSKWLKIEDNHGIYNKSSSSYWWLASPSYYRGYLGLYVDGNYGYFYDCNVGNTQDAVRPVVCIPTSVFNSGYTLEDN